MRSIIKKTPFFLVFIFLLTGCVRVNTSAQIHFNQVKKEIAELTDQTIYWDQSLGGSIQVISKEDLLKNELTDEFVVQIALLNNLNLKALYENLGIAQAKITQAGLLKNPIFSFSDFISTTPSVTNLINIGLFQNFLEILLIPLKKKMAKTELEVTQNMLITQILDVIAETKIAFYKLQADEQIWELKKRILLATELSYEVAQKLFIIGNITDLQKSLERSNYEQAKLDLASWEITVLEDKERLNVLMGLWGTEINWKISTYDPGIPSEENDFANVENEAIFRSYDLKVAHNHLLEIAAAYRIDTSKLIFPQFNAGAGSQREDSVWYVGPGINLPIPLFDFGQANSAKARSVILQQWNQYTALAIYIRSKARSSRFIFLNAYRQSRYLESVMVPLAEEITHSVFLQHNAMQLGVFDLLVTKRHELDKKIQFVQQKADYRISKIILETLLNGHVVQNKWPEAYGRGNND